MKKRLLIYSAEEQGQETLKVARAIQRKAPQWDEIIFVDDHMKKESVHEIPVITFEKYLEQRTEGDEFVVANGEPIIQRELTEKLRQHNCALATVFHPSFDRTPYQTFGEGVFISEGTIFSDYTTVGDSVCINAAVIVGHDCVLGNYVTVAPGTLISGGVTIGEGTYIGPGVIIRDEVKIGKNCVIGMGSLVTKDIPDNVVAFGAPCHVARENTGLVFKYD